MLGFKLNIKLVRKRDKKTPFSHKGEKEKGLLPKNKGTRNFIKTLFKNKVSFIKKVQMLGEKNYKVKI